MPLLGSIALAGALAAAIGIVFGLPSLRLRGFYLAVATLAAQFFVQLVLSRLGGLVFGGRFDSGVLDMSQHIVLGALIVTFLIAEPDGLAALCRRMTKRLFSEA